MSAFKNWSRWLSPLARRARAAEPVQVRRNRRPERGRRQPQVECLEDRTLMDANNFTSVALFFNLADPAHAQNAGGYQATTAADIRAWLHEGEAITTSSFMRNYWSALSYGHFQFGVDANRDASANPVIPSITPASNNGDDWSDIAAQVVRQNPDRIWQISGSWTDGGKRVIPSVVVVQHYNTGASAWFSWGYEFTSGGQTYRVNDIFHIGYNTALINDPSLPSLPGTWGTMAHEYSHNFLEGSDLYGGGGGKVGYWDLLGDNSPAGHMSDTSSFYKNRLHWLSGPGGSFKQVLSGPVLPAAEYRLRSYATTGEAIKVVPDPVNNPGEYFLLEYRRSTGTQAWVPDGGLQESGLLITHINERLGDGAPGVVADSPFMDIEEADGNDGRNWGSDRAFSSMPWFDPDGSGRGGPGEAKYGANNWPGWSRPPGVLYPFQGNNSFTPATDPGSNFYGGRDSGLRVTNIRQVGSGSTSEMVFTIEMTGNNQATYTIGAGDQVYAADFTGDGKDELLAFNGNQMALIDNTQNQYLVFWQATTWLGGWHFGPGDKVTVADFNGDGKADVFLQGNTGWAGLFVSDGQGLTQAWLSGDPAQNANWVGNWHLGGGDQAYAGDFDGDGKADIFIRNGGWAAVLTSTGEGFTQAWMSGDPALNQNWVGNWHLGPADQAYVGDFDGDGKADVFLRNGRWAGLILSTDAGFTNPWTVNEWVGGWHIDPADRHYVGDFNGDGKADILIRSDAWAGLLLSTGTGFNNAWIVNGTIPSQDGDPNRSWQLGPLDRIVVGDLNGDGLDDIFVRSGARGATLISQGNALRVEWIWGDLGLDDTYRPVAGRFNYDRSAEVFLYNGTRTAELVRAWDSNAQRYGMWWGWSGSNRIATKAPPPRPEQFYVADFTGDGVSDVLAFGGTRLALYENIAGNLQRVWQSGEWVGGWHLGPDDRLLIGDFNGDGKADIFVRSPHWAGLLLSTGRGFNQVWMTGDPALNQDWIGNWHIGPQDREYVGDFNGDGKADIYIRSPRWAGLLLSTGSGFTNPWNVNEWLGGWHLGPQDREYVGDFTGDGKADVFVRSPHWAGLFRATGTGFTNVWMTGDPALNQDWIGNWHIGPLDKQYVGDFNGDGKADIFIRSPSWAGLLLSTGSGFTNPWIVNGSVGGWQLGALDRAVVGDFNGDGKKDVYVESDTKAAVLVSAGNQMAPAFVQDGRFRAWVFNSLDQGSVGRFSGLPRDELFVSHPGGWTGVLTPSAATPLSVSLTQAQFREVTSEDLPSLSINDVALTEGNSGTKNFTFTLSLSRAASRPVTVSYATADGTATAGSDYIAASGTLTFYPGESSKTVTVLVNGDTTIEPDETFFVNLNHAANANLTRARGVGTILNDDLDLSWSGGGISGPASVFARAPFTVSRNYNILGAAAPANFTIGYYASVDAVFGNADDVLLGTETISAAADKAPGNHAGTSPALQFSSPGSYYLFAKVDNGNAIVESNEANNVAQAPQRVTVPNRPPVLAPIADRSVPSSQDVLTVPLSATDPDGDPVTFSATAQSLAYVLDQRLRLGSYDPTSDNFGGRGEKWLLAEDNVTWHFILPNGQLYLWDGSSQATGTLEGTPGASYWANPDLLVNAVPNPHAALSVSGSTLTIDRDNGFIGSAVVTVTASDGRGGSDSKSFTVTVTKASPNRPPVLVPVADRTVPSSQGVVTVPLSASDPDGDTLAFTATAQSLAYVLVQQTGALTYDPTYDNSGGRGEKWLLAASGQWYFLLASGQLSQWDGGAGANGALLGNVGRSYYADPTRLMSPPANQPHATVSVSGSTLTITRDPGWVGGIVVTVTASDGLDSDSTTFTITVT